MTGSLDILLTFIEKEIKGEINSFQISKHIDEGFITIKFDDPHSGKEIRAKKYNPILLGTFNSQLKVMGKALSLDILKAEVKHFKKDTPTEVTIYGINRQTKIKEKQTILL